MRAMRWLIRGGVAVCATLLALQANALTLGIVPANTATTVGSSFSVAIVVDGLDADGLAVVDYDFDLLYGSAVSPTSVSFGGGLGGPAGSSSGSVTSSAGVVDLFEVSLLPYADLRTLQGNSFTLATVTFTALMEGVAQLSFAALASDPFFIVDVENAASDLFSVVDPQSCGESCATVGDGAVRIAAQPPTQAPEPGTLPLLAAVLGALALARACRGRIAGRRLP